MILTRTITLFIVLILLAACGSPPADTQMDEQVNEEPASAKVEQSTLPPPPAATAEPTDIPEPTATPEGQIFRDDFTGSLQPGWTWETEDPAKWSFVDVEGEPWLQIIGNADRTNVLTREVPEGDFAIVAHIKAEPHLNFHQANIFIFQDSENYIVVNTGFCQPCPVGGHGYFMETVASGGDALNHYEAPRAAEDTDVYLKIEVVGDIISGYFATTPDEWTRIGRFGNFYELNTVGLSATNSSPPSGTPEDIVAQFDYFEILMP